MKKKLCVFGMCFCLIFGITACSKAESEVKNALVASISENGYARKLSFNRTGDKVTSFSVIEAYGSSSYYNAALAYSEIYNEIDGVTVEVENCEDENMVVSTLNVHVTSDNIIELNNFGNFNLPVSKDESGNNYVSYKKLKLLVA